MTATHLSALSNLPELLIFSALIPIVIGATAGFCIPALRRPAPSLIINLMVAATIYRRAVFGLGLWMLCLYGFTRGVEWLSAVETRRSAIRWNYACAGIAAVIGLYAAGALGWLNGLQLGAFALATLVPIHDMWLLLRSISYLWEFGSGKIRERQPLTYAIWISLPFTMTGPMIRYSEFAPQFAKQADAPPARASIDRRWWERLGLGIAQMAAGAAMAQLAARIEPLPVHWPKLLIIFLLGPWGFYLTVGGTFHLMECMARLWEIDLPQSFNYPFGQPNLSEFWNRWNMTVTRMCRDYLFYNRWGLKRANVYLNLMAVFLAVGLWHDLNLYWGTWGLLHGAGFCVYFWYRTHKERFELARLMVPARTRRLASIALTYVFVCLAWYLANKIVFAIQGRLPAQI